MANSNTFRRTMGCKASTFVVDNLEVGGWNLVFDATDLAGKKLDDDTIKILGKSLFIDWDGVLYPSVSMLPEDVELEDWDAERNPMPFGKYNKIDDMYSFLYLKKDNTLAWSER